MATENHDNTPHIVVRGGAASFKQEIIAGKHRLVADEPVSAGGGDAGPDPYDYLLASLGVCTSMTVGLYARRRQLPLENITVLLWHSRIHAKDCERVRNQGRNGGQNRRRIGIDRRVERRTARGVDGHRGKVSRPPHAHIGDQYSAEGRSEIARMKSSSARPAVAPYHTLPQDLQRGFRLQTTAPP